MAKELANKLANDLANDDLANTNLNRDCLRLLFKLKLNAVNAVH